ncbi:MAG TPA: BON domain-containing protein [Candidatus Angelobacter sp.]
MPRMFAYAVLALSSVLAMAQQQGPTPDPAQTQQPPQNQANPQDKSGPNMQMQSNITSALSSDPTLSGANVQSSVDDVNITLTGSVQSKAQMDRVLALVSPYAQYRNIVNKVVVH